MKIGIVGLGAIGSMHVKNILDGKIPNCEIACVCDERVANPEKFAGLKICGSIDETLSDGNVDAVLVATPSFSHFGLAKKCLEAGRHVLVEKPAALSSLEVKELEKLAGESGKVCGVMLNQRTTPIYARIKELVSSGALGKINRASWFMTNWYRPQIYFSSSTWRGTWRGEAGGALINQSIHNIDVFAWVFGLPSSLRAWCKFGKYHDIEVEDEATAFMEYDGGKNSGMTASFCTCTGEHPGGNRFEIAGEKGFLKAENDELHVGIFDENLRDYTLNTKYVFGVPEYTSTVEKFSGKGEQHVGVLKNFVSAVESGSRFDYDISQGYDSVCLANAMLLSSWRGADVKFPFDDASYAKILSEKISKSVLRENPETDFILEFSKSFR